MRIVRFEYEGHAQYGALDGQHISALEESPFSAGAARRAIASLVTTRTYRREQVKLLAPCEPSKYIGVGLNYRATADALGLSIPAEPLVYLRPSTGIIGTHDDVVLPRGEHEVVCEGELALVIGRTCRNIGEEDVQSYTMGYVCANDLTDVSYYKRDQGNPTRSKARDTFGPVGPWIDTDADLEGCSISTAINGRRVQYGTCSDMIFSVARCVSFISKLMTLLPGDIITTGAPPVPAKVREGDLMEVSIDGIGVLSNRVAVRE